MICKIIVWSFVYISVELRILWFEINSVESQNDIFHSTISVLFYANKLVKWKAYRFCIRLICKILGVLLYALLNGFLPFDDDNLTILYRKIKQGKYETPDWLSQDSEFLLAQLLQVDPKKRITMTRLLRHRWLTRGGLAPVECASKERVFNYRNKLIYILYRISSSKSRKSWNIVWPNENW